MFLFSKKEKKVTESDLKRGFKKGEFVFYYQPEFDLKTGKIVAVEALLRWNAPNTIVPPNEFIPVLENSSLIEKFTEFLLQQTLTDLKAIHKTGLTDIVMAVNLSTVQLEKANLVDVTKKILKDTEMKAGFLEFEITESQQLVLPEMQKSVFKELADLGISISIDDFGTGYSSFNYLRFLDVQKIKIDCEFVRTLEENPKNKKILSSIIHLGHKLNTKVLAEGIETTLQKEWLEENGCDLGQGFWFSRPLPLDQLILFLGKKSKI